MLCSALRHLPRNTRNTEKRNSLSNFFASFRVFRGQSLFSFGKPRPVSVARTQVRVRRGMDINVEPLLSYCDESEIHVESRKLRHIGKVGIPICLAMR